MEIKQGATDVPIFIKPRLNKIVITMAAWEALYGAASGSGVFTLVAETADKTDTEEIVGGTQTAVGVPFTLPASMFVTAQRDWTVSLKFVFGSVTDFSLYNFDIKVSKGESPNSR